MTEPAIQLRLGTHGHKAPCTRCYDQPWRVPRKLGACPKCGIAYAPEVLTRGEIWRPGPLAEVMETERAPKEA